MQVPVWDARVPARRFWTLRLAEPAHPMAERLLGAVYCCVGVVGCAPTVVVEFLSHEPQPKIRPNGRRRVAGPLFVADLSRQSRILQFTLEITFLIRKFVSPAHSAGVEIVYFYIFFFFYPEANVANIILYFFREAENVSIITSVYYYRFVYYYRVECTQIFLAIALHLNLSTQTFSQCVCT